MLNYDEDLTELVESLICTGREDDWWDFKECYHEDRAALLHDIICLANNRADRDTYLILGVRDKTFEIMGVENDPHRRNQQNIVDFLSQKEFAGQIFQHAFRMYWTVLHGWRLPLTTSRQRCW